MNKQKVNYDVPQNTKDTVVRLWGFMKQQRIRLSIIGISIILYTTLSIYIPFKSANVIDSIWKSIQTAQSEGTAYSITWNIVGKNIFSLSVLYLFTWLFYYLQSFLMASVADTLTMKLREKIGAKLNVLPLRFFDQNKSGEILSRVTNDLDKITETLQTGLLKLFSSDWNDHRFISCYVLLQCFVDNNFSDIYAYLYDNYKNRSKKKFEICVSSTRNIRNSYRNCGRTLYRKKCNQSIQS